jgi:ABC-2 type transport system permease protein
MKSLIAFTKKEFLEQHRTGRFWISIALFILIGIMNPAIAKLTPWFFEMFADSLAESGIVITEVNVSALDSWMQYYKNLPIALISFVLLQASIFTKEYHTGTLVLSLTKGLGRFKVVLSKTVILVLVWSLGYWLSFSVTYLYNSYFWDNSVAQNLLLSVVFWWMFGIFVISLMTIFSTFSLSNTGVLLGTGGIVLLSYAVGFIPKINKYLPTFLADGNSLIYGVINANEYIPSIVITAAVSLTCFFASIPIFNKKQL